MEIKSSPKKLQPEIITPTSAVPSPLSFTEKHPDLFRLILVVACAILIATFIYWKKQQDLIRNVEDTNRANYIMQKALDQINRDKADSPTTSDKAIQNSLNQINKDKENPLYYSSPSKTNDALMQLKRDNMRNQ